METLTISLPKIQTRTVSISFPKKLVLKAAEVLTALFIISGAFIWLFI